MRGDLLTSNQVETGQNISISSLRHDENAELYNSLKGSPEKEAYLIN